MVTSRRQAIGALAGAGAIPLIRAQGRSYKTALIGAGWWGTNILRAAVASGETTVVGVCDVDSAQLKTLGGEMSKWCRDEPRRYAYHEEMLAKEKPEIVIVATPDHWHPLAMIDAVKAGAHVYVEKPVAHTLREGRAMVKAARAANRVVQVGTHRRVSPHNMSAREFLLSGRLGRVGMVRAFVHSAARAWKKTADAEPPAGLDWNRWCGPAPMRAFNPAMHPRGFRQFLDYANGTIGDWGIHWFDQILWWSDEKHPKRIFSSASRRLKDDATDAPDTQTATFEFERFTVQWEHRMYGGNGAETSPVGCYFYGSEGTLHLGWRDGWTFFPAGGGQPVLHEAPVLDEPDQQNIAALWRDFLNAIKSGRRPVSDIEAGHQATAMSLLAMASARIGRSLVWDGVKEAVVGDEEANKLLSRVYRSPWRYPDA